MAKIGRNEPCHCGSGLKYKKCHGAPSSGAAAQPPFEVQNIFEAHRAAEHIRRAQQGLGRPIVGFKVGDHQAVAVGRRIYYSKAWKTFPDFLADYIKQKLGTEWGNAELAKPFEQRHPVMQWYDAYCRYQIKMIKTPGQVTNAQVTGIVACYLGLAYSLYLLDHNVEIQNRLIARLKDPGNFQGAYYELFVANVLIRAGFRLTLEDETDGGAKHCEFAAVSRTTGKKYWVEAKMRAIAGILAKTQRDGGADHKPLSRLIPHLNAALDKPAADERFVFIDLNAEPAFDAGNKPTWHDPAVARLERYEAEELKKGEKAYVFVTNIAFHRQLDAPPKAAVAPFGLGMPDYNRPGTFRVTEIYRRKQKHIDAHEIGTSILAYTNFPNTFDGGLPSEAFGAASSRVKIGESYFFPQTEGGGMVGRVTTATVNEPEKKTYIGVSFTDGTSRILAQPMSEADLNDYRAYPDAYFGRIMPVGRTVENQYELFEWFMDNHKVTSREKLLEWLARAPDFARLQHMSDDDLRAEYCERLVAAVPAPQKAAE